MQATLWLGGILSSVREVLATLNLEAGSSKRVDDSVTSDSTVECTLANSQEMRKEIETMRAHLRSERSHDMEKGEKRRRQGGGVFPGSSLGD